MVFVAQLVRALDCGSRGRRFESGLTPLLQKTASVQTRSFFVSCRQTWRNMAFFYGPISPQNISIHPKMKVFADRKH